MKAKYNNTFEYGRKIAKYLAFFALGVCAASLLAPEGSAVKAVLLAAGFVLLAATLVVMYKFCRCPYCGKRILTGILTLSNCPRCRRSLVSGKKVKR